MPNERRDRVVNFILNNMMSVASVIVVLMLVIPLPKILIDICMALNIALSIVILLIVIYTPRAADFSQFPRIILFATLFGLGINISSTRLILRSPATATGYSAAQSSMVQAFANIVTGGSVAIGMIIFIILIVIQVVVITKGATRVSEVAARFSLDSMNSKSLDIDSQLNNGYITETEAREQKAVLRREIDFYSHMDGSSKFVSGNVKAGIFITVVNMIGGIIAGMNPTLFNIAGMPSMGFGDAFNTYARLTIGDGLMSQIPALMLSFATGLIVTASSSEDSFDESLRKEFSVDGTVYQIVGAVLAIIGIVLRNHTQYLLVPIGVLFVYFGIRMARNQHAEKLKTEEAAAIKEKTKTGGSPADVDSIAPLDPLSLELGYALIPLVDKEHGAELLERITRIRREVALDMGLEVPRIRIVDNMTLEPNEYCFKIRGIEAGRSNIRLGYYMCMNAGGVSHEIEGEKTKDPAFGMAAIWVPESRRMEAEQAGYAVVDPPTIIATHLTQIIRMNAADILGRQEVASIISKVKETNPVVVDEVMNGDKRKFTYGEIQKVLQSLLREQVSIRNRVIILETLANYGPIIGDTWMLAEKVREALGLQICMQYADNDRKLRVMNLSQSFSELLLRHQVNPPDGSCPFAALDPVDGRRWIKAVSDSFARVSGLGYQPVVMCPSHVRLLAKVSTEREVPGIVFISDREVIAAGTRLDIEVLGEISDEVEGNVA